MYISVSGGSTAADFSDLRKHHAKTGKGINDHKGVNNKQKELGGSPAYLFANSKHVETKTVEVNGNAFTEAVVKTSTQERIDKCKDQNRPCLLLPKMGLSIHNNSKAKGDSPEVTKMKNATHTLKKSLTRDIGMAAHPDNRKGVNRWLKNDTHQGDPHPWYNMPMIFYFKGRKEDVKQYQQKVEAPNKEEFAVLLKKREDAKNTRLAEKMMEK